MEKPTILFLCTGNSCRSQMGEAWAKHLRGEEFEIFSAGTKKHGMNPYAVKVMEELGISMEGHFSKTVDELPKEKIDYVITVCSDAHETCPLFPASKKTIHHGFDDPPRLVKEMKDEEEILNTYRRVRDEIKTFVETLQL